MINVPSVWLVSFITHTHTNTHPCASTGAKVQMWVPSHTEMNGHSARIPTHAGVWTQAKAHAHGRRRYLHKVIFQRMVDEKCQGSVSLSSEVNGGALTKQHAFSEQTNAHTEGGARTQEEIHLKTGHSHTQTIWLSQLTGIYLSIYLSTHTYIHTYRAYTHMRLNN